MCVRMIPAIEMAKNPYSLAEKCDALVVCTEWNEFKQLDLRRIRDVMRQPIIVDGRNIYDPKTMIRFGFIYRGVGRGYDGDGRPIEKAGMKDAKTV
jgi:UDPglucose 6-dehydrogenase